MYLHSSTCNPFLRFLTPKATPFIRPDFRNTDIKILLPQEKPPLLWGHFFIAKGGNLIIETILCSGIFVNFVLTTFFLAYVYKLFIKNYNGMTTNARLIILICLDCSNNISAISMLRWLVYDA